MEIHNPGNTHPIDELYAFLSVDEHGNEGIVGGAIGNAWFPLVTSERERAMGALLKAARDASERSGVPVRLVRFTCKEVILKVCEPRASRP